MADKKYQVKLLAKRPGAGFKQKSSIEIQQVRRLADDTYLVVGLDTITITPGEGAKDVTESAAFTHILRRQNGKWLLQHEHFSSRRSPSPPAK